MDEYESYLAFLLDARELSVVAGELGRQAVEGVLLRSSGAGAPAPRAGATGGLLFELLAEERRLEPRTREMRLAREALRFGKAGGARRAVGVGGGSW